jgi:hypothetical protein
VLVRERDNLSMQVTWVFSQDPVVSIRIVWLDKVSGSLDWQPKGMIHDSSWSIEIFIVGC